MRRIFYSSFSVKVDTHGSVIKDTDTPPDLFRHNNTTIGVIGQSTIYNQPLQDDKPSNSHQLHIPTPLLFQTIESQNWEI